MKRSILIAWVFAAAMPFSTTAQKKNFSYDQLFSRQYPNVSRPLPVIQGWVDDAHYLENRINATDPGSPSLVSVDVKTGNAVPYSGIGQPAKESAASINATQHNAKNITASPDGKWLAYTKANNLFALELATGKETQITNDGSDSILNGYASWLYYEEILGRSSFHKAFWWSPDSRRIAYMRFDDSQVPVFPIYIAEGQHGYLETPHYPKAGDKNPEVKIGIASIEDNKTTWADFNASDDQYFGLPLWTPAGELWVQWMNRKQDTLIVYRVDKQAGGKKQVYLEHQSTWIDLDEEERISFLSANKGFIVKSDKDGWDNLYLYDMNGKLIDQVTTGNFWGTSILAVDEKSGQVYIKARKDNSARFDVYKMGLNGKGLIRLSFGNFSHDLVSMSPGGKYFITTYSALSSPPAMSLVDNRGKIIREIGNSKGEEFDNYAIPETSLITVKSGDGIFDLPMTVTYPINFDPAKKYPVLISIYGGPNSGTVFDRWRPAAGFNQWWAQEGIIQVAMDNRSSGHFGKKGINYIYHQLGKWEIEDYMTCGRWLRAQPWADTSKIAMMGGSFGGYMTCMALTYGADVFNYGVASYSVTDWQLYDSHYTERFMGTPEENPEGYKKTSVLTYASRYKGLLRIVHGASDDNVHMQNSIQLINLFEDMNRHFELMIYPGERHGTRGIKDIHNRMETSRFIYRYLLNGNIPAEMLAK